MDSTKIRKDTSLLLGTRLAYLLNSRRVPGVQKGVGQAFAHAQLNNGVSFPGLENDEVRTLKSSKRLRHGHSTGLGFILSIPRLRGRELGTKYSAPQKSLAQGA